MTDSKRKTYKRSAKAKERSRARQVLIEVDGGRGRDAYAKAADLAADADEQGLPSERLWAAARALNPARGCACPRRADSSLATPRHEHLDGCPDKGKRSGKSGKPSAGAISRARGKQVTVSIEGGKDALVDAARLAGYESGSALVAAAIAHVEAGGKFIS